MGSAIVFLLICLVPLSSYATPNRDHADALAETGSDRTGEELFLEVSVNGVKLTGLYRVVRDKDRFYASAETIKSLGIAWPMPPRADGMVWLNSDRIAEGRGDGRRAKRGEGNIPPMEASTTVRYDEAHQTIALTVPATWLTRPLQQLSGDAALAAVLRPTEAVSAVLLNYDLYGQRAVGENALSVTNEFRLLGGHTVIPGVGTVDSRFSSSSISRWTSPASGAGAGVSTVRLDSAWEADDPDSMISITAGDFVSGGLDWSRSERMGGIQIKRSFALQPYRTTTPVSAFSGTAALPSTVDLFINGIKQSTQSVLPGQFVVGSTPSINGAGQAQMVITDLNGATRTVTFPLYATPQLLKLGMSDWSAELGVLRTDYGTRSSGYGGAPVASLTARDGLTERLTLETHSEMASLVQLVGVGGVGLLPYQTGVLTLSGMASHTAIAFGLQMSASYQWSNDHFNFYVSSLRRDAAYRDAGSATVGNTAAELEVADLTRSTDSVYCGMTSSIGQIGLSWLQQRYTGQSKARYVSLSLTKSIFGRGSLSLNVNRDLSGGGSGVYLGLSMPLGRLTSYSANVSRRDQGIDATVNASHAAPSDLNGWGWRAEAALGQSKSAQAELTHAGGMGQTTGGASSTASGSEVLNTAYVEQTGSIILTMGDRSPSLYAGRRIDDAFAVVDADGVAGIPVRFQNRLVGETNADGRLFVEHLNAFQHNILSIDTLRLPPDVRVGATQIDVMPSLNSGAVARFSIQPILAVQLSLVVGETLHGSLAPGSSVASKADFVPVGSRIEFTPSVVAPVDLAPNAVIVGYDGAVYLENPKSGTNITIAMPSGSRCRTLLPTLPNTHGYVDLGTLPCVPIQ